MSKSQGRHKEPPTFWARATACSVNLPSVCLVSPPETSGSLGLSSPKSDPQDDSEWLLCTPNPPHTPMPGPIKPSIPVEPENRGTLASSHSTNVGPPRASISVRRSRTPGRGLKVDLQKTGTPRCGRRGGPARSLGLFPRHRASWAGRVSVLLGGAFPSVSRATKVTNLLSHVLPQERELEWRPITECSPYGET